MMKRAIPVWFLGLSSMMLAALAIGCVGAPEGDEEPAKDEPIAVADRPAFVEEQAALREAEEGAVNHTEPGAHPERWSSCSEDATVCCTATLCCYWPDGVFTRCI
jgi:hypothetical protein